MASGFRNPFGYQPWREKRTFQAMFDILEADIVVMQETKIQRKDLQDDMVLVPGWDVYFSLPQHKKGYSGVAIYTRNATCAPILAEEGVLGILCPPKSNTPYRELPEDQRIGGYPTSNQLSGNVDEALLDSEGRCVVLEFPAFVLFGVYSPANRDESRIEFRQSFVEALDARIRNLITAGKQVILTGDLNIVRSELDSSNVAEGLIKEGMTMDEWQSLPARRIFNQLVFEGTVIGDRDTGREHAVLWDICRCFHPRRVGMHTCWDTKRNTRPANVGSRIDYILCSDGIKDWIVDSNIQEGLMGSDHCPVYATMSDKVTKNGTEMTLAEAMNPSNMFETGRRVRDWEQRDALRLSAKLIPEFDRRRNIREMFTSKASQTLLHPEKFGGQSLQIRNADMAAYTARNSGTTASSGAESTNCFGAAAPLVSVGGTNNVNLQRGSQTKRRPDGPAQAAVPTNKRGKNSSDTKTKTGQTTLQGFFKPKTVASLENNSVTSVAEQVPAGSGRVPVRAQEAPLANGVRRQTRTPSPIMSGSSSITTKGLSPAKVFDPIEAKESWSKLLGKRVVPKCEHDEPCISLVTKKPGVNCGRSFYICPRPLGPSGDKERDTEWRCGTFIWSSDWTAPPH
uniref:DNA-(apurinic or apyrimidinic site) endonuclease 2 n=1 Tax=Cordyceps militaris TaxID=73501 RepID=Q874H6_CORMI|nr:DNA lyase [Cordyceps militaris]